MSSFYSRKELEKIGFAKLGYNVLISRKASIYGASNMIIGNHVRIDDFCFLLGKIKLGNYIHVAPYCNLVGGDVGIEMQDFSAISSRGSIYAVSDDYSGSVMTNPTVPKEYTNVIKESVMIEKHSIIGASSVILPGVIIREGSACGAMSLLNKSTEPWSMNVGIPAKKKGDRKQDLLEMERKFMASLQTNVNQVFYEGQEYHDIKTVTSKEVDLPVSYISEVLSSCFPGPGTIYMEQSLKFLEPVNIGDELDISVKIMELQNENGAIMKTEIIKQGGIHVVDGEVLVKLPKKC